MNNLLSSLLCDLLKYIEKNAFGKLNDLIKRYSFYYLSKPEDLNHYITENFKKAELIIIKYHKEKKSKSELFFIGFMKIILIINQSSLSNFQNFFSINSKATIFFLNSLASKFSENISINNVKLENISIFEEINSINNLLNIKSYENQTINKLWNCICSCISGYLIMKSYIKAEKRQSLILSNFFQTKRNDISKKSWTFDDFIMLKILGIGSTSIAYLIYGINEEELFALKIPNGSNRLNDKKNLFKREINNFTQIDFQFFPKYYGWVQYENYECPIIQFIDDNTLDDIDNNFLDENDKLAIILELLMSINYLHENNFVHRDLKPNNIIIDKNKNLYVIDFDRMIKLNESSNYENHTADFLSPFTAPDVKSGKVSYQSDIYSIRKLILYIFNDECKQNGKNKSYIQIKIQQFCELCNVDSENMFNKISELMFLFLLYFQSYIKLPLIQKFQESTSIKLNNDELIHCLLLAANQNYQDAQFKLAEIYYAGEIIDQDINKSIHYFTLAADQNHPDAQYNLGVIFYKGEFITRDINKSIHYFTLAADQNHPDAQYNLGAIYYAGEYIKRDIKKSFHYFTLAANQNNRDAQFYLGVIYNIGELTAIDMSKAIHYYSLAAYQNHLKAQFFLGEIYFKGPYGIKKDINKAIQFYSMAANQNHSISQNILGLIYYTGEYITQDINKSIYYFSLASNNNDTNALNNLGSIYYLGKYKKRDINKAIHYFTLSANKNDFNAQFILGFIYYFGQYIPRDINKALHNFSLAANKNHPKALYYLGEIYYKGKHITRDINKAIYYFTLSANKNDLDAQFILGLIYYFGQYTPRDINKALHYFSLAANKNHPKALYYLGLLFYYGKRVKQDFKKMIYYFSLAANQNHPNAQYTIGFLYLNGLYFEKDINKGLSYLLQSASNGCINANFVLGCYCYEGKHFLKDINKSIHYFKEASSFNCMYSKNNLGVIYKNEFNVITDYFDEAIKMNDRLAMYNLSIIYIYEGKSNEKINNAIKLLRTSIEQQFNPAIKLFCIALIKKYRFNLEAIKRELLEKTVKSNKLYLKICKIINKYIMNNGKIFNEKYEYYETNYFMYDCFKNPISVVSSFQNDFSQQNKNIYNITKHFYDGFGIEFNI